MVLFMVLVLSSCAGRPIHWQRWSFPPPGEDSPLVLRQRIREVEEALWRRHVSPEGLLLYRIPTRLHPVAGVRLDLADQACWTGYLLAALSFQHACEPSPRTLERVRHVLEGLRRLQEVTGTPGLLARCIVPAEMVEVVQHRARDWRRGVGDGSYAWRGDASKDQYSGYLFGLTAALRLVEDEGVQAIGRRLLAEVARHLHRGGLRIHDERGRITTFGDMRGRILGVPIGVNAILSLAILRCATHLVDDRELREAARWRAPSLLGAIRPLHFELLGIRNYNNDLMAAVSLASLALLPGDAGERKELRAALREFLRAFRGEGNAFFVSVGALYGLRDPEEEECALKNLLSARLGERAAEIPAQSLADLPRRWLPDRKGRVRSREALPLGARADSTFLWRSNPFLIMRRPQKQAGIRYSGVDLVIAYWLGRYSRWLRAPRTDPPSQ